MDGTHPIKDCKSNRTCGVKGCTKKHNRLLHFESKKQDKTQTENSDTVAASTNLAANESVGMLQLVNIMVSNPDKTTEMPVTALLDSGSSVSYIDKQIAQDLSLSPLRSVSMSVSGILGSTTVKSNQVSVLVRPYKGQPGTNLRMKPFTHEEISIGKGRIDISELKKTFSLPQGFAKYNV